MTTPNPADLAAVQRQLYRTQFDRAIAEGTKTPFVFPLAFIGGWAIPTLYLAIPHRRRPWLYHARWAVLAVCVYLGFQNIMRMTAANAGNAYMVGCMSAAGIMGNFTLLIFKKPQWEAKRVQKYRVGELRKKYQRAGNGKPGGSSSETFQSQVIQQQNGNGQLRQRNQNGKPEKSGVTKIGRGGQAENGLRPGLERTELYAGMKDDECVYGWQEYPENGSFLTRFDWALHLTTSCRMTSWNWAVPVLPPFEPPAFDESGRQLPLTSLPNKSRFGFSRSNSRKDLLFSTLSVIIPCYLVLDLVSVWIKEDPHFNQGPYSPPSPAPSLPPSLAALPPLAITAIRNIALLAGLVTALHMYWNLITLLFAFPLRPIYGFRSDPWHLVTMSGSFSFIADRGLTGFWGVWWHQTLRFWFAAPTEWAIRHGYLRRGSPTTAAVGTFIAFALSGFLHAAGSYSALPSDTRPWIEMVFFLLQGVGMLLQRAISSILVRPRYPDSQASEGKNIPRWIRRAGNLGFAFFWAYLTGRLLYEDLLIRAGMWMFETVPFSFVRWAGLGTPGLSPWRTSRGDLPTWMQGKRWWESGLAL